MVHWAGIQAVHLSAHGLLWGARPIRSGAWRPMVRFLTLHVTSQIALLSLDCTTPRSVEFFSQYPRSVSGELELPQRGWQHRGPEAGLPVELGE